MSIFLFSQACNSNGITYVPLYDTLGIPTNFFIYENLSHFYLDQYNLQLIVLTTGANAVEYIINHAEISLVLAQENKLPAVCYTLVFLSKVLFFAVGVDAHCVYAYYVVINHWFFMQILSCLPNCSSSLKSKTSFNKLTPHSLSVYIQSD